MSLRDDLIEAGVERIHDKWHAGKPHSPRCLDCREDVQLIIDAFVDTLVENATPLYDAGGIASAYYVDDEPDDDTIWVVDLAALRGGAE